MQERPVGRIAVGLAIETSSDVGTVALDDQDPPRVVRFTEGLSHGKLLLPSIESLLKSAGLRRPDYVAVGIGPGSYTGLRIGVTVARTLAWTWEVPLLGIHSLTALALEAGWQARPVVTLVDAKQGEVYAAVYRWQGGLPRVVQGPVIGAPDELRSDLPAEAAWIGDGCRLMGVTPIVPDAHVQASGALKLARERFLRGERDRIPTVLPLYLRPSEAERRLEARS
jgi:tRNA threonylcarbamoyladenosine biosynthesis protein TsaB